MKFFKRNNSLFVPKEEMKEYDEHRILGRSQVGYSRRTMLGFLGLGALAPFVPPLPALNAPSLGEIYMTRGKILSMDYGEMMKSSSALLALNEIGDLSFEFTMVKPLLKLNEIIVGQMVEFDLGDFGKELFEVERTEFKTPVGENMEIHVRCHKPNSHLDNWSILPIRPFKV